ncbi:ABC transporter sub-family G-like protein 22 [Leptotrombidium deliense]|uniref:ABC transporter sub-family G-like protein 22 n=1 Tax=Leptotrombidium deliense TaxID=299467 RepID=A0A443RWS6_9ACAR|nr:ABC transporter sub-family G-like protein 22 [Leptotrombidium deliense]
MRLNSDIRQLQISLNGTLGRNEERYSIKMKNAIAWSDLDVFVSNERKWFRNEKNLQILKNISGRAESGELFAVLGASGSGKTTLLNVLSGRNTDGYKIDGKVNVNGRVTKQNTLKFISGYVQQNDLFMDTFTVYEHLVFQVSTSIRLPFRVLMLYNSDCT